MAEHQSTQPQSMSTQATHGMEKARQAMSTGWEQAQEMAAHRPMATVATSFGVGFGTGLLLAALFGPTPKRRESTFEQIGRNVMEAINRVLPEGMTNYGS